MRPRYEPSFVPSVDVNVLLTEIPWENQTAKRRECFMTDVDPPLTYSYGVASFARTYMSIPMHPIVREVQTLLNARGHAFNMCFLNRYDDLTQEINWHADDSPTMDHDHPIAVVSFGARREIWWKPKGARGETPHDQRQLLGHGSLFMMPAGFQRDHFHRIPRADRAVTSRVSFTFRRFLGR